MVLHSEPSTVAENPRFGILFLNCVYLSLLKVKLGVGGFSMGAATSLYSATCFALGKYGNGNPYPINLSTIIGLSGWLPCAKYVYLFS